MTGTLSGKLLEFSRGLTASENDNFKLLLGLAAGRLADHVNPSTSAPVKHEAFKAVVYCTTQLQPHASRVPPSGVVYHGRPAFLEDTLLSQLAEEAAERRKTAIPHDDHFLGCGGPIADRFALSKELHQLVEAKAGPVTPTGIASYIYYDKPGAQIEPHVDTEVFSLNCILMLRHHYSDLPSHTVVYPVGASPSRYLLKPGELLVLFADSVIHAREAVKEDEVVNILTIGYQPKH